MITWNLQLRMLVGICLAASLAQVPSLAIAYSDGTLDLTFGTGGIVTTDIGIDTLDGANAVAIQTDGKIVVAGESFGGGSLGNFAVVRFTTTGDLDPTFGNGGIVSTDIGTNSADVAYSVALQTDGKIVVGGYSWANGSQAFAVVRYTSTGDLDSTFGIGGIVLTDFGSNGGDIAYAVAIQTDGRIVVAGVNWGGSSNDFAVVRYTTTGELDPTFGVNGIVTVDIGSDTYDSASAVAVQADGKILVAGHSSPYSSEDFVLVRFTSTGELDLGFGINGIVTTDVGTNNTDAGYALAIQADGKILVAGVTDTGTSNDFAIFRHTTNGSLDLSFGSAGIVTTDISVNTNDYGKALVVQRDGKIIVAGESDAGGPRDIAVVRYTTSGALDLSFGSGGIVTTDVGDGGNETVAAVALQDDGSIVVAGGGDTGGSSEFVVVRYSRSAPSINPPGWLTDQDLPGSVLPNTQ